ncbi:MAG: NAD(P)-binding protein, partial [Verrucomicrobiales bacterium]
MVQVPPDKKVKVLVLGAGFGGLDCCKTLTDPGFEVTLLDRQN